MESVARYMGDDSRLIRGAFYTIRLRFLGWFEMIVSLLRRRPKDWVGITVVGHGHRHNINIYYPGVDCVVNDWRSVDQSHKGRK